MECVLLAAAFAALRPIQTFGHSRKRQQAARTPYASRGSVTDRNNRAPITPGCLKISCAGGIIPSMTLRADDKGRLTCSQLFPSGTRWDVQKDEQGRILLTRLVKQ